MIVRFGFAAISLLGIALTAGNAVAQTPPPAEETPPPAPAEPPPAVPPPPPMVAEPMAPPPPVAAAPAGPPSLKLEDAKGNTIKVGLLFQPQFQAASSNNAALGGYSDNLFIRRTRILLGGTLFGAFDYFLDTDFPNLFIANLTAPNAAAMPPVAGTAVKNGPGMYIQDAFITWKPMGDVFKVDAGFMLPPMAHNALQGAGTLYGWDYYAYSFRHNESFNSTVAPVGRDLGVQLRGLVVGGHLEYRAGLFQGLRDVQTATDVGSRNFFRATARVQVNFLDPEPGFFYAGTYLGKKSIASIGGSFDIQDKYKYFAGDGIADLPAGPGVFTAQVNFARWDGGTFITSLPKQTAIMGEVGYNIAAAQISPIVRYEHLSFATSASGTATAAQTRYVGGLAYWPYGHNSNLKAFYSRVNAEGFKGINQINLQWQLYFF